MRDLNILSLDLEFNQPSESIIQVGCVVGNLASGEILEEYSQHIKIDEIIAPRIIKLTGIKQNDVDNGITLQESYTHLVELYNKNDCNNKGCTLTWGGGDTQALQKSLGLKNYTNKLTENTFYFGRRWIDVKTVFISYQLAHNLKHQAGLAKALVKLGLNFEGKKHNACDDARNTFYIYRKLLKCFNQEQSNND